MQRDTSPTHAEKTLEIAELYLSRQPVHAHSASGEPLWSRGQILRAFCAGQVAVIDDDTPAPVTRLESDDDAIGPEEHAWRKGFEDGEKHATAGLAEAQALAAGYKDILDELSKKIMPNALLDVIKECRRQVTVEGWTPEHDDQYTDNELARAAACYAIGNVAHWPWSRSWWKPKSRRRDLERAAAMIIKEIERLDRANTAESSNEK